MIGLIYQLDFLPNPEITISGSICNSSGMNGIDRL